ncbi:MAG: Ig-like domain-containing protein, partial [Chloroflexota bacterium]
QLIGFVRDANPDPTSLASVETVEVQIDDADGAWISVDSLLYLTFVGDDQIFFFNWNLPFEDGTASQVRFRATDFAGNQTISDWQQTTIDTVAPDLQVINHFTQTAETNPLPALIGTISDGLALESFDITIYPSSGSAITGTITPVGEDWFYTLNQPVGSYNIYLEAVDTAGNNVVLGPFDVEVASAAGNNGPVAQDDISETFGNEQVIIDVLSNDSDADDDPLHIYSLSLTQPSNGSVMISGNQIIYTPATNHTGLDTFTYQATDGLTLSTVATVTVTVKEPQNFAPTVSAGENVTITLPADATLVGTVNDDGLPLNPGVTSVTWSQLSGPGTATFTNANSVSTSVSFSTFGSYTLRLTADDGDLTASDDVVIVVEPVTSFLPIIYVSSTSAGVVSGITFVDEDILSYDQSTGTWMRYFDGSDVGLGLDPFKDVDAFTILDDGSILLSIAGAATIQDVGAIDDSDIVRFIPTKIGPKTEGTFEMYFDGSDVGLDTDKEDIDAISVLDDGRIVVSTLGPAQTPKQFGNTLNSLDEDLIVFTPTTLGENTAGFFSLYADGSDFGLDTPVEDMWGIAVLNNEADLYINPAGIFDTGTVNGSAPDFFSCTSATVGSMAACGSEALFFDGTVSGIGSKILDGIHVQFE